MAGSKMGFWTFDCPCGAQFQVTSDNIMKNKITSCPNCSQAPDPTELKGAIKSLYSYKQSIFRITNDGWRIIPPED